MKMDQNNLKKLYEINNKLQDFIEASNKFEDKFNTFYSIMNKNNENFVVLGINNLKKSYKNETALVLIIIELINQYIANNNFTFKFNKSLCNFDLNNLFLWMNIPKEIQGELRGINIQFNNFTEIIDLFSIMQFKEDKKLFGQYYTPPYLVDNVLKISCIENQDFDTVKIADPACGSGAFLRKIILILFDKKLPIEKICDFINKNLFGFDINPFAVLLCKITLLFTVIDNCVTDDNVKIVLKSLNFNNIKNINTLTANIEEKFDIVIGNPPYFKIINSILCFNKDYNSVLNGQGNIYVLFIYWSILHTSKGGHIGLIIPQSIRSGVYFKLIRDKISNLCLKDVILIDAKKRTQVFTDAEQAVLAIHIQNNKSRVDSKTKVIISQDGKEKNISGVFEQRDIISEEAITLPIDMKANILITRIKETFNKFSEVETDLIFGNGLFVWNQNKGNLTTDSKQGLPIIYGNYIVDGKFIFCPEKNNLILEGGRKPYCLPCEKISSFIYSGVRLIVKRTSGLENYQRINSCLISNDFSKQHEKYLLENHINMLYFKEDKNILIDYDKLLYLDAFLRSSIVNFIFKMSNGNTQVSASELNNLPYPNVQQDYVVNLIKKEVNFNEIDMHFYRIFGVKQDEIEMIEKYKGGFSR